MSRHAMLPCVLCSAGRVWCAGEPLTVCRSRHAEAQGSAAGAEPAVIHQDRWAGSRGTTAVLQLVAWHSTSRHARVQLTDGWHAWLSSCVAALGAAWTPHMCCQGANTNAWVTVLTVVSCRVCRCGPSSSGSDDGRQRGCCRADYCWRLPGAVPGAADSRMACTGPGPAWLDVHSYAVVHLCNPASEQW